MRFWLPDGPVGGLGPVRLGMPEPPAVSPPFGPPVTPKPGPLGPLLEPLAVVPSGCQLDRDADASVVPLVAPPMPGIAAAGGPAPAPEAPSPGIAPLPVAAPPVNRSRRGELLMSLN